MADTPGDAKKGSGLFGGGKPHPSPEGASVSFLSQEISSLSTRLRVLEERNSNMRKKQELVEQSMLSGRKKVSEEVSLVRDEIDEIKRTLVEVENRIIMLIKELRLTAKKEDVDTMTKYIEMWEPVNFVTQNQVEKIIREILDEEKQK